MSKHKFTADRSDMAHNIKRALLGSTAVQPPPVVETGRWGEAEVMDPREAMRRYIEGDVALVKAHRQQGKTEALREMISNPAVEVTPKEAQRFYRDPGDRNSPYHDMRSTDD